MLEGNLIRAAIAATLLTLAACDGSDPSSPAAATSNGAGAMAGTSVGNSASAKVVASSTQSTSSTQSSSSSSGSTSTSGSTSGSTPNPGGFSVSVSGTHFVDGSGKVIQLRGANVSGLEGGIIFGAGNTYWSSAGLGARPDFTKLAAWKLNVVRMPLNEDSWLGSTVSGIPGNAISLDGSGYRAEVAASVAAANAAGLYVILDLHWTAPAGFAANAQNPMADAQNAVSFWTQVADAFKGNHAVLFELFNEPYIDPASSGGDGAFASVGGSPGDAQANLVLRNGGTASYYFGMSSGSWNGSEQRMAYTWQTAGYQTLIDAIRSTGATNVILAGGNHYSNDLSWWGQAPPSDPAGQLGAAIHLYPGGYPNNFSNGSGSTDQMIAQNLANYPVIVTEFGDEVGNSNATFTQQMTSWLDQHGYSVTAWAWNPWGGGSNVLIQNSTNYAPTVGFGQTYHDWAVSHQ